MARERERERWVGGGKGRFVRASAVPCCVGVGVGVGGILWERVWSSAVWYGYDDEILYCTAAVVVVE